MPIKLSRFLLKINFHPYLELKVILENISKIFSLMKVEKFEVAYFRLKPLVEPSCVLCILSFIHCSLNSLSGIHKSVDDLVKVVNLHHSTIRKRMMEFAQTESAKLTTEELRRRDATGQNLPGSDVSVIIKHSIVNVIVYLHVHNQIFAAGGGAEVSNFC